MVNSNERLLLFAAKKGARQVIADTLENHTNLRIDARDHAQKTALLLAVEEGHYGVVDLLLTKGANVQVRDPVGMSPLHIAAWQSSKNIAKLLLQYGADVNARNNIGQKDEGR